MKRFIKTSLVMSILFSLLLTSSVAFAKEKAQVGDELTIVAHVTIKPEYKDDMLKAFKDVVEGTRKEAGNVSYILHEHIDNPNKFTFVEVWKSPAAIEAHNNSAHFQKFAKAIEGKADLEVYTMKEKF